MALADGRGLCVVGDKRFDSDKLPQQFQRLGATHCIPRRARCGIQRKASRKLYRQRYRIENYFCRHRLASTWLLRGFHTPPS